MEKIVITIPQDKMVCEVEGLLLAEKIYGAPLIDPLGKVVGCVSKTDIIHFDFIGGDTYTTPVSEICRVKFVTVDIDDDIEFAAKVMISNKVNRLMVTQEGLLVGMLSETNIVNLVSEKGI